MTVVEHCDVFFYRFFVLNKVLLPSLPPAPKGEGLRALILAKSIWVVFRYKTNFQNFNRSDVIMSEA